MRLIFVILFLICLQSHGQIINASQPYRPQVASCSYLLDQYPNAAAAYSLRKLDCDYSGSAIRVRRSSDNSEQDIGFTSNGDLDTAALKTFVSTNSGYVVTWYDQSGNSINCTQSTVTYQPKIVNSGNVNRTSNKPMIDFGTGSDTWFLNFPTGFLYNETSISFISVLKITDFANYGAGVFCPLNTHNVGFELYQFNSGYSTGLRVNSIVRNNDTSAAYRLWSNNVINLTEIYADNSSLSAFSNTSSVSLTNSSALPSLNFNGVYSIGTMLNKYYNMYGSIQEIIIYTSNKISNRTSIESNINNYYSIY